MTTKEDNNEEEMTSDEFAIAMSLKSMSDTQEKKCEGCKTFETVGVHSFSCPIRNEKITISTPTAPELKKDIDTVLLEIFGRDDGFSEERAQLKSYVESLLQAEREKLLNKIVESMKVPSRWQECQKIYNPHGRYDVCALCGFSPEGYREAVYDVAKSKGVTLE